MMKQLRFTLTLLVLSLFALPMGAQTIQTSTTLSAAVTSTAATTITVASATGISRNSTSLFFPISGEVMSVNGVSGTIISVSRGANGTRAYTLANSATVLVLQTGSTVDYDPGGSCTRGQGLARFSPVVNTVTGNVWVCTSGTWAGTNLRPFVFNSFPAFTQ